ncbi:platelet-activating factor acetylhydrolase IB subunit alpha1-like [Adelges cooleyi]|uniref:platelet-activating factor acetylhydrolase IB subunit alpha1-like n=1 Tax=Adelges cooleyi TaxID=133065 RepID=UPI0021808439|nr:platelet-activating factor acetylhydrolase IB subunit alpha1-like [Adelges cooleyi]
MNPCVVPEFSESWKMQHEAHVAEAKSKNPDILLIGASIIECIQWCPIWKEKFVPLNSVNFGISGDCTQHVLWRVQNGILDHIKPKVCILNVGSNNLDSNSPVDISEGILTITKEITSRIPECNIFIIGILPCGPHPNPFREKAEQVNIVLSEKVKQTPRVNLIIPDILQKDGTLSEKDAPDFLHPSELGYRKIFNPILPQVLAILNK